MATHRPHIDRLTSADAQAHIDPLLREYMSWIFDRLARDCGFRLDDVEAAHERHHAAFRAELPTLRGRRGRLLLARHDDEPVGIGAFKPAGAHVAEIKRMYVRPQGRGSGVGRALLQRLVDAARSEGYRVVRLESLCFMTEAHALYRSMGFVDTPPFEHSEADLAGVVRLTRFMALPLHHPA